MNSSNITIFDGGMGGELIKRGASTRTGLWSAQALISAPDAVARLHQDYIDAGARVITTNTYSTVPSYLDKKGMGAQCGELTRVAAEIARKVADASPERVLVAGSLPPLSESYRADLSPNPEEARPVYRTMATAMADLVDLFLCETMSSSIESRNAAVETLAARQGETPVYVSWTLHEEPGRGLRSDESVEQAFEALSDLDIDAFLFNCTTPEAIEVALGQLRALTDKPIGAYPNRIGKIPEGWTLDNEIQTVWREDLATDIFIQAARKFQAAGASMIGGCCGIGPEDIAALTKAFSD